MIVSCRTLYPASNSIVASEHPSIAASRPDFAEYLVLTPVPCDEKLPAFKKTPESHA